VRFSPGFSLAQTPFISYLKGNRFLQESKAESERPMPRMKILDSSEQASFDKPPLFGSEERKRFFEFSATVLEIAERFRTPCHRIGFLLAYGYFRATKKFYSPLDYPPADIAYVAGH
jgi:hypothetical protein